MVCHADSLGNAPLLLASVGCDRIWLSPAGGVEAVGLAAEMIFGNRLLERLHVQVDFLQIGKYKGASEPFTRDSASPEARQTVESTLRGVRAAWVAAITDGRGKPALVDHLEDGPFAPEEAKAKGFVDEIGYADDARDEAKKLASAERVNVRFGSGPSQEPVSRGLVDVLRAIAGPGVGGEPHIAVVPATGAISMGGAPANPLGGSEGHHGARARARRSRGSRRTRRRKRIVLRIDSPGGIGAPASDLLWKRLMKLRTDKPLVVVGRGLAASGGYTSHAQGRDRRKQTTSGVDRRRAGRPDRKTPPERVTTESPG